MQDDIEEHIAFPGSQEMLEQDEMTGTADGQELGQPLDYRQDKHVEKLGHGGSFRYSGQ